MLGGFIGRIIMIWLCRIELKAVCEQSEKVNMSNGTQTHRRVNFSLEQLAQLCLFVGSCPKLVYLQKAILKIPRLCNNDGLNRSIPAEDSSLRVFSTVTDLLNKSLGVASYNRKLAKKFKQIDNPVKMEPIIGKMLNLKNI